MHFLECSNAPIVQPIAGLIAAVLYIYKVGKQQSCLFRLWTQKRPPTRRSERIRSLITHSSVSLEMTAMAGFPRAEISYRLRKIMMQSQNSQHPRRCSTARLAYSVYQCWLLHDFHNVKTCIAPTNTCLLKTLHLQ